MHAPLLLEYCRSRKATSDHDVEFDEIPFLFRNLASSG
jgi:hypothetical protein